MVDKVVCERWCVTGGGRRRWEAPGIQNQKQEPHTKMWGVKGPDNPTSQLLPIMSTKGCSGDGEERKDKGGGETVVCDKVVFDVCMCVMYVLMY